jgi:O-antigen/teichoic acid export membrane protein
MNKQPSFLNAIKWSYISVWGEKAFSVIFNFVLAAILGPRDFGMVAIAWVYVTFIQMFLDQGLVCALIQKKDLDPEHTDSVFWMDVLLGLFLLLGSILGGHWWAHVNHSPEIARLIDVLSITIPLEALSVVPRTLIQKNMDFKSLSVRANAGVLISGALGVGLAYRGFGPWALVWQQIIAAVVGLILLWTLCPWRPQFRFSWIHLRSLLGFSSSNFLAQLGIAVEMQSGSILLGIFFGPVAVGLYRFADRIMSTVISTTTTSVQAVSLPEFSRLQDKPKELRESVLSCIRLSSSLTLPAMAGLAVVAGPLMATIGSQWTPAADVLTILCILGVILIFAFFTGPLLQALGKPHHLALLEWARALLGVALLLVSGFAVRHSSLQWQLIGITLSRFVLGAIFVTPVFLYILMRLADISLREFSVAVIPSSIAAVSVVVSVLSFRATGLLSSAKPAIVLVAEVALGATVGLPVLLRLDGQLRRTLASLYRRSFRRQSVPSASLSENV